MNKPSVINLLAPTIYVIVYAKKVKDDLDVIILLCIALVLLLINGSIYTYRYLKWLTYVKSCQHCSHYFSDIQLDKHPLRCCYCEQDFKS